MKRALIITGKSVQDQEFIYPYYRLQEAGYEVDVANKDMEEFTTFNGIKIMPQLTWQQLVFPKPQMQYYDILVLPGGAKALEYIRQDSYVLAFVKYFSDSGKTIAAICHGTQLLISAKVVKGKKVSGYYSIADDIINAGAEYVDAPAVVDGNLVTSPHYKYLGAWMMNALMKAS
jgi:protease I